MSLRFGHHLPYACRVVSSMAEKPPRRKTSDSRDRMDESLRYFLPQDSNIPYDMKHVVKKVTYPKVGFLRTRCFYLGLPVSRSFSLKNRHPWVWEEQISCDFMKMLGDGGGGSWSLIPPPFSVTEANRAWRNRPLNRPCLNNNISLSFQAVVAERYNPSH